MRLPLILGLALTLTTLGLAGSVYACMILPGGPIRELVGVRAARFEQQARFLMLPVRGIVLAQAQFTAAACLVALGLVLSSWFVIAAAMALVAVSSLALTKQCDRRLRRLERQLEGWLLMLSNALRASPSVVEAVSNTLVLVPRPFAEEVDLVVKEIRLGVSLRRGLAAMSRRVPSVPIRGALTAIVIASETGGDLPGVLQSMSGSLRESARLDGVLRTKTAEGRGQLTLLATMPFVLYLGIRWLDPSYFDPVASAPAGRALLALCIALWLSACFWAYRIVRIDL